MFDCFLFLISAACAEFELSECDRIGGSYHDGWVLNQLVNSGLPWEYTENREACLERLWSEHGEESQVSRVLWWVAEPDAGIRKVLLAGIVRDELELNHGLERVEHLNKLLSNLGSADKSAKETELAAAIQLGKALFTDISEPYRSLPRCPSRGFSYCVPSLDVLLDDDATQRIATYSNFPEWLNKEDGVIAWGTLNLHWLAERDAAARCMLESADDALRKDKLVLHMSSKIIARSATPPSCKRVSQDTPLASPSPDAN